MSDEAIDSKIEAAIAAERLRCIDQVLTYAALREQAAVDLDRLRVARVTRGRVKGRLSAHGCKRTQRATSRVFWPKGRRGSWKIRKSTKHAPSAQVLLILG